MRLLEKPVCLDLSPGSCQRTGRSSTDGSGDWLPATHVGDVDRVLAAWFQLQPRPAIVGTCGVNQCMGAVFLCVILPFNE